MSGAEFTAAMSVFISGMLLVVVWCCVSAYRSDNLRDELFALRDEMFLYAVDHEIVATPAHENLRLLMNHLIRYAHHVSLSQLILLDASERFFNIKRSSVPPLYAEWKAAVRELPADEAKRMRDFHESAMMMMMKHMITGSPFLWAASIIVVPHLLVAQSTRLVIDSIVNSVRRRVPSLDLLEADALSRPITG